MLLTLLMIAGCAQTIRPVADLPIAPPKIQWQLVGINGVPHTKVVERQRTCEDSDLYLLNHTISQQTDGYVMDSQFIKQGTKLNSITFVICAKRYYPGQPPETGLLGGRLVWERNGQEIASIPLKAIDHQYSNASDAAKVENDIPEQFRMAASPAWTFVAGDKIRVYITGGTDTGLKGRIKLLDFFASIAVTQP